MPIPVTARLPIPFYPPAANTTPGKPVKIMLRIPTYLERDSYTAGLIRAGIIYYSKDQIRELAQAGAALLYGDDKFDEVNASLEMLWQVVDSEHRVIMARADRLRAIAEQQVGLPDNKRMTPEEIAAELEAIMPEVTMPDAQRVKAVATQQEIMSRFEPLQKATSDLAEMDSKRAWHNVQFYVVDWEGLEHNPDPVIEAIGLRPHEVDYLRKEIGRDAFEQISDFITSMMGIDGDEEKNLDSLLANMSDPTGSLPQSDQASSDGSSTDESTPATLAGLSPKTPASSSEPTTSSRKKTDLSGPSPMAVATSTSQ